MNVHPRDGVSCDNQTSMRCIVDRMTRLEMDLLQQRCSSMEEQIRSFHAHKLSKEAEIEKMSHRFDNMERKLESLNKVSSARQNESLHCRSYEFKEVDKTTGRHGFHISSDGMQNNQSTIPKMYAGSSLYNGSAIDGGNCISKVNSYPPRAACNPNAATGYRNEFNDSSTRQVKMPSKAYLDNLAETLLQQSHVRIAQQSTAPVMKGSHGNGSLYSTLRNNYSGKLNSCSDVDANTTTNSTMAGGNPSVKSAHLLQTNSCFQQMKGSINLPSKVSGMYQGKNFQPPMIPSVKHPSPVSSNMFQHSALQKDLLTKDKSNAGTLCTMEPPRNYDDVLVKGVNSISDSFLLNEACSTSRDTALFASTNMTLDSEDDADEERYNEAYTSIQRNSEQIRLPPMLHTERSVHMHNERNDDTNLNHSIMNNGITSLKDSSKSFLENGRASRKTAIEIHRMLSQVNQKPKTPNFA